MTRVRAQSVSPLAGIAPLFYVLGVTTLLCIAMLVVREDQVIGSRSYRFLLWNLFLAWLPLLVALAAGILYQVLEGLKTVQAVLLIVSGLGWMVLYPNAPYLTTDFIHLIVDPHYRSWRDSEQSLLVWYDLVVFFLFAWCGLLLGYLSMYIFHQMVWRSYGRLIGWLFIGLVSFLGGFGVYLGRTIRLNSWDLIFSPFRLIDGVFEGLTRNGAIFTVLFAALILIVYVSLSSMRLLAGPPAQRTPGSTDDGDELRPKP